MRYQFSICLLIGIFLSPLSNLWAEGVALEADQLQFDQEQQVYNAAGDVHLNYKDVRMTADAVTFDNENMKGEAEGNVVVEQDGSVLHGKKVAFDLAKDTGEVHDGKIFVPAGNFTITSNRIERLSEQKYRLDYGEFTTCEPDDPAWKFSAHSVTISDGYLYGKHAMFYLKNLPVFYFPYFIYPTVRGRESGFLIPSYGVSSQHGQKFSFSYYQVLGRNMDATILLDTLSKTGTGVGAEYRYLFGENHLGTIKGYHISGIDSIDDSFVASWQHLGGYGGPNRWRLITNMAYVSSQDYYSKYGTSDQEYTREVINSTAGASYAQDRTVSTLGVKYTRDLTQSNDTTLQYLPTIGFTRIRAAIKTLPLSWGFDGSYSNLTRSQGETGGRIQLQPGLTFAGGMSGIRVEADLLYRQQLYSGDDVSNDRMAAKSDFVATAALPLSRSWQQMSGENDDVSENDDRKDSALKGWRHLVEPQLQYRRSVRHDDATLFFDHDDVLEEEDTVAFRLVNRLYRKSPNETGIPTVREVLYLNLAQEYYLNEAGAEVVDKVQSTMLDWIWRPTKKVSVDGQVVYDFNDSVNSLQQMDTRIAFTGGWVRSISAEHRYLSDDVDYLSAQITLDWKHWLLTVKERYAFDGDVELEKGVSLVYFKDCWGITLSYVNRPDDKVYTVGFNLSGVGGFAGVGGVDGWTGSFTK